MLNTFCLNMLPINQLQNLSSYEIVYGRKLRAIMDLQLEGDNLTRLTFYRFSDYLDLLNECVHAILDIVKEHHNQTIQKWLVQQVSEIIQWRWYSVLSFSIKNYYLSHTTTIYKYFLLDHCTFSPNMTSSCISYLQSMGRSLSRHFTCHVSNKVFWDCQMANVKNINDYKLEMIRLRQQHVILPVTPVTDSS